jgi:hypothetical protein
MADEDDKLSLDIPKSIGDIGFSYVSSIKSDPG